MLIPPMSSPVCMACVPASYVDLECKHLFESADVAAAGAQGCSCDSLVYVYLRREQDGVHCLSNLTKIKNNIGNVYSSHCVHIHHVYSSPCVHIHHVYSSTSLKDSSGGKFRTMCFPERSGFCPTSRARKLFIFDDLLLTVVRYTSQIHLHNYKYSNMCGF